MAKNLDDEDAVDANTLLVLDTKNSRRQNILEFDSASYVHYG